MSLPGYATAPDLNSRTVSEEDQELLGEQDISHYRKEIMSIAWLVRTRPNIATAVTHKQTRCSNPRIIDQRDLDYMIGFLANNINAGIVIDCKDIQLYLYFDVGHGTHDDKRSHTGGMMTMGKLTRRRRSSHSMEVTQAEGSFTTFNLGRAYRTIRHVRPATVVR